MMNIAHTISHAGEHGSGSAGSESEESISGNRETHVNTDATDEKSWKVM
jgi:hypothetical protein